ncbi:hypothetical protein BSLG_005767 [Batrachochytrium salamandrivorans]|nr:hypothetical protein BSLG_005767 [Batrachochytrium salamandrivorans]
MLLVHTFKILMWGISLDVAIIVANAYLVVRIPDSSSTEASVTTSFYSPIITDTLSPSVMDTLPILYSSTTNDDEIWSTSTTGSTRLSDLSTTVDFNSNLSPTTIISASSDDNSSITYQSVSSLSKNITELNPAVVSTTQTSSVSSESITTPTGFDVSQISAVSAPISSIQSQAPFARISTRSPTSYFSTHAILTSESLPLFSTATQTVLATPSVVSTVAQNSSGEPVTIPIVFNTNFDTNPDGIIRQVDFLRQRYISPEPASFVSQKYILTSSFDGVLGLGFTAISINNIPTPMDNMIARGLIPAGIFDSFTRGGVSGSSLTLGGLTQLM